MSYVLYGDGRLGVDKDKECVPCPDCILWYDYYWNGNIQIGKCKIKNYGIPWIKGTTSNNECSKGVRT